ncbi:hypothetical protein [Thioalkalivibrio sp. ALR17-21]|uniref:hypothetical protein n=1 Tax=Thioalkalivibrio sp. ALR17-21 TaxID=1269813 RepID=UPI000400C8B0|nr:hypothetical protein [Thioalkalivibrio sp. ALR17-21]
MSAVIDRGERIALMEPLVVGEGSAHRGRLTDRVLDLVAQAVAFRARLPVGVESALADWMYPRAISRRGLHT